MASYSGCPALPTRKSVRIAGLPLLGEKTRTMAKALRANARSPNVHQEITGRPTALKGGKLGAVLPIPSQYGYNAIEG